ncbi:hypothetical protein D9M68_937130 [compost metagenome]
MRTEDARHLFFKMEAQTQYTDHGAGFRMVHAARIDQCFMLAGTQIGGAKGFNIGIRHQRLPE